MNDSLQIIVTVLGILSQLVLLGKQFYSKDSSLGVAESATTKTTSKDSDTDRRLRIRHVLDLSFVLLCSAFFSLLLTDSLVISGRNPAPGATTILIVLVITSVVVLTMVGAWLVNLAELVTGFLAITTFIVLIISSGGPFFSSSGGSVVGLALFVPIISLVILSSAMLIYSFGSPLNRTINKLKRMAVSLSLITLVLVGAAALGKQLLENVINDIRTPKISDSEAKRLLQNVMQGGLQDRRNFYKYASEISLAPVYKKNFRTVNQEQQGTLQVVNTNITSSLAVQPKPSELESKTIINATDPKQRNMGKVNNAKDKVPPVQPPQAVNPTTNAASSEAQRRKILQQLIDEAWARGDYENVRSLQQIYFRSNSRPEILKDQGIERTNLLANYFEASDMENKEKYLSNRLNWIHPVGLDNQSEAVISLPGTKVEERFQGTSSLRIIQALNDQPNLRQKILQEFEYPEQVRKIFANRESSDSRVVPLDESDFSQFSDLYKRPLFPKFDTTINNSQLQIQLGLPLKEESYTAYRIYKQFATLLIKQQFKGRVDENQLDSLTSTFNSLDDSAQDAFLNYVINNKKVQPDKVYQMLLDFKSIDFSPLSESQDPLVIEKLSAMVTGKRLNEELQGLADKINAAESKEAKDTFVELIRTESPDIPIKRLFQPKVFDLVDQIHRGLGADKKQFFDAVADPVWLAIRHLASIDVARNTSKLEGDKFQVAAYLDKFRALKDEDQAGILHQLAVSLYQPGGPYALDPLRLLVAQARSLNDSSGFLCASLIALPLLLLCIPVGGFFSRKLVARDRMRELISEEITEYPAGISTQGSLVELYGRQDVLQNLERLAERGWSTIGIVGRRGVGKSRLLYSLYQSGFTKTVRPTIKVWVASPSKFQEEDFIHSLFERLALSAEGTVAAFLGAKPISIRRIENRAAQISAWLYAGTLMVLGLIVYQMLNRLTRSDIVITWLPILALVFTSGWFFVNYITKLQPVDLSFWLQRDRSHNPHTVMLYREVYEVLKLLRNRTRRSFGEGLGHKASGVRLITTTVLGGVFVLLVVFILMLKDSPLAYRDSTSINLLIIVLVATIIGWAYIFKRNMRRDDDVSNYGQGLMSLIADYRSFASTIVYRIKQGALGTHTDEKFSVLICVDELDKIVEIEEIRTFIRRIKAVFEVPGVYYYISLAEDTLTALYLGSAVGKNEIDSAFDHIINIPALRAKLGEEIASEYLKTLGFSDIAPKMPRTIATISFGIPRDIIRRCDELRARNTSGVIEPSQLASELRRSLANIGYELHQLSRTQVNELNVEAMKSTLKAQACLNNGLASETEQRLVLSIWLIALTECAISLLEGEKWEELTEEICRIGYRIPVDPIVDIKDEIDGVHTKIFVNNVEATDKRYQMGPLNES